MTQSTARRFSVAIAPPAGARVSRLIFGADLEPLGRVIYGGLWDRERDQPRADVKAAIGALGITAFRFPGSSSASAYHWRDGIGPHAQRPHYDTTYWSSLGATILEASGITGADKARRLREIDPGQPNQFGTDEFLQYCLDTGAEPVLHVNIGGGSPRGEGTPEEAAAWVRYCNVERKAPRPVHWWQFGNEVWGNHEPGHAPPRDYAQRVIELATAMRREDPSIKLIGVAVKVPAFVSTELSTRVSMPNAAWNREVFAMAGEHLNAAAITWAFPGALTRSLGDTEGDALQMTTGADNLGTELDHLIAELDAVGGAAARLPILLGEWGRQVNLYEVISDNHALYDGVFFAGCLNKMIQRAGRVVGAHLAFFLNTFGVIQTVGDRHFVTAAYLVHQIYRRFCRREQAPVTVQSEDMLVPALEGAEKAVFVRDISRVERRTAILDSAATVDESGTTVYITNRSIEETINVTVSGVKPSTGEARFRYITAESPYSRNTLDAPNAIRVAEIPVAVRGGRAEFAVPPCTAGALIAGPLAASLMAI